MEVPLRHIQIPNGVFYLAPQTPDEPITLSDAANVAGLIVSGLTIWKWITAKSKRR